MEEIKVGEYIRTKDGIIRKYHHSDIHYGDVLIRTDKKDIIYDFEIVKHSSDIKDLVQAGDIVTYKICKSSKFYDIGLVKEYTDARRQKKYLGIKGFRIKESQIEIMEILTKEQFDSRKYIVGDESNVKD